MDNIYALRTRFAEISDRYDEVASALAAEYEATGGEITEETEEMEASLEELASLRKEVIDDVLSAPDEYASLVKNAEAQKKVLEAELKVVKEEQQKVLDRIQAKINRKTSKIEYFKDCIAQALDFAGVERVGGAKTDNKFSIYFTKSTTVEAEPEKILAPYQSEIDAFAATLPSYITVKTDIKKSELKKIGEGQLPDGATIKKDRTLQIR